MDEKLIFTSNFWGTKIIPAILTKVEGLLPGRSNIWIPDGYGIEGGTGGYSTRAPSDISEFTGSADMRQDVLQQWATEKQRRITMKA